MDVFSYKKRMPPTGSTDEKPAEASSGGLPNSVMESIAHGTMAPTAAMLGRRENIAPSLQEKMQGAFGADFSNLEVYRSETARDVGMLGVASGNKVALSPDIDLNSHAGQAVLGHELSHVVAQAKGIGSQGRGIMETPSLERQAMVEGERAASGMRAFAGSGLSVESAMDTAPTFSPGLSTMGGETLTPISSTPGAFGMGAPMQGKWNKPENNDPLSSPKKMKKTLKKGSADEKASAVMEYLTHYTTVYGALQDRVTEGSLEPSGIEDEAGKMLDSAMKGVVENYLGTMDAKESDKNKDEFVDAIGRLNLRQAQELAGVYDSADKIATANIPGSFEDISNAAMEGMAPTERAGRMSAYQTPEAQEKYRRRFHNDFYVTKSREASRMDAYLSLMGMLRAGDDGSDPDSVFMRVNRNSLGQRDDAETQAVLKKISASQNGSASMRDAQAVAFGPGGKELQKSAKEQRLQEALRRIGKK